MGRVRIAAEDGKEGPEEQEFSWPVTAVGILVFMYLFLIGLALMGDAFKCLGGRGAGQMFTVINNPMAGLMVGILATVLVQSSSTTTSIVVDLVSSDQITVRTGIPIIMGANIGTSVTNTIVAMGQMADPIDLERAFSAATVHDVFNMLTVCTLLPLEIIPAAMSGEGGLLYWISKCFTEALIEVDDAGELFQSPIKAVTKPVSRAIISNNKYVINALSLHEPVAVPLGAGQYNATLCGSRRLGAREVESQTGWPAWQWTDDQEEEKEEKHAARKDNPRALLNRRLADSVDCSQYYCVGKELDTQFKKISTEAYEKELTKCGDYVLTEACSDSQTCYLDAGAYYTKYVTHGRIIKGGMVEGAGDRGGGLIALMLSLLMLFAGLFGLVRCLQMLLIKKAKKLIIKATQLNDYIALAAGMGITIVVQSSSVVTSALTPLCGMGVIPLEKMLPLTLGANIGTTVTALIAALATMKFGALQIALCHLLFNVIGICIWFPAPFMRKVPLNAARLLGLYASFYRIVPALYILFTFVVLPGVMLGLSALYDASKAGGILITLHLVVFVAGFGYWWISMGGCYTVLPEEDRRKRHEELAKANSEFSAGDEEQPAFTCVVVVPDAQLAASASPKAKRWTEGGETQRNRLGGRIASRLSEVSTDDEEQPAFTHVVVAPDAKPATSPKAKRGTEGGETQRNGQVGRKAERQEPGPRTGGPKRSSGTNGDVDEHSGAKRARPSPRRCDRELPR